jgi:RhoGEF domain
MACVKLRETSRKSSRSNQITSLLESNSKGVDSDWLLTIVQRTPRYLLLLKDLIAHTHPDDPEHAQLFAAHAFVSESTFLHRFLLPSYSFCSNSNTVPKYISPYETLSLLALQQAIPIQLVSPGNTFLCRGPFVQVECRAQPCEREVRWMYNGRAELVDLQIIVSPGV